MVSGSLPLQPGDTGAAVLDLQRRLAGAGHPCGDDDLGDYGVATEASVRAFQERRGLRADGVCGDQTWSSLVEAGHQLGDRLLYVRSPMLRGDDVAELQRRLHALGFDAGKVDGIHGPRTSSAVTEFQQNTGLTTDGICGPDTIAALRRVSARLVVDGPGSTVAELREAEGLWGRPRDVAGLRIAVGAGLGIDALADAVARGLGDAGATVAVLRHPEESARAAAANAFEAGVFVALAARDDPGARCAYYAREGYESVGGRRLAELLGSALAAAGFEGPVLPPVGMRVPLLRETRMPAVVVEVGPPAAVVAQAPAIVTATCSAVGRWVLAPADATG